MEKAKMVDEDVVEEHNGVYGAIWHIVSQEGFDLPEGLEYLKDAQNEEITVHGSKMEVDEFVKGVRNIMGESNVEVNVEITDCSRTNIHDTFRDFEYLDLTIQGCRLTFNDLKSIIASARDACTHYLDLSKNVFEFSYRDLELIKHIGHAVGRNRIDPSVRKLNLKDCNFDDTKKAALVAELGYDNLLEI